MKHRLSNDSHHFSTCSNSRLGWVVLLFFTIASVVSPVLRCCDFFVRSLVVYATVSSRDSYGST